MASKAAHRQHKRKSIDQANQRKNEWYERLMKAGLSYEQAQALWVIVGDLTSSDETRPYQMVMKIMERAWADSAKDWPDPRYWECPDHGRFFGRFARWIGDPPNLDTCPKCKAVDE